MEDKERYSYGLSKSAVPASQAQIARDGECSEEWRVEWEVESGKWKVEEREGEKANEG